MAKIKWKQVEDYPNYMVSTTGKVKNIKTRKFMQRTENIWGVSVILSRDSKSKQHYIQYLVARAFMEIPDHEYTVWFKDDDRWNPRLDNLILRKYEDVNDRIARGKKSFALTQRNINRLQTDIL